MTRRITIVAAVVVLAGAWTGSAQDRALETGSSAVWENATAGPLNTRAPGRLVIDGMVRHNTQLGRVFSPPEITQTQPEQKIVTGLKIAAIQELFDYLNTFLLFLDNAIRAQAGFAPYVPNPIRPGGAGGLDLGSLDLGTLLDRS